MARLSYIASYKMNCAFYISNSYKQFSTNKSSSCFHKTICAHLYISYLLQINHCRASLSHLNFNLKIPQASHHPPTPDIKVVNQGREDTMTRNHVGSKAKTKLSLFDFHNHFIPNTLFHGYNSLKFTSTFCNGLLISFHFTKAILRIVKQPPLRNLLCVDSISIKVYFEGMNIEDQNVTMLASTGFINVFLSAYDNFFTVYQLIVSFNYLTKGRHS